MKNKALVSRILLMMAASVTLTVMMVLGTLAWTAREHDLKAAQDAVVMVEGGYAAAVDKLGTITADYSVWEDAYYYVTARDIEWMTANLGAGAVTGDAFHLLAIVWPEDRASVGWETARGDVIQDDLIPGPIVDLIRERLKTIEQMSYDTVSFAARLPTGLYMLAASRIERAESGAVDHPERSPINIVGLRLDDAAAATLGATFLIEDLHVIEVRPPTGSFIPLRDLTGDTIAYLAWTAPQPGEALIRTASMPLAAALSIFLALSIAVARLAGQSARALVRREAYSAEIARTDNLTGLANRMAFGEQLVQRTARGDQEFAILFMDVNGFKLVNDTLGHAAGDDLVKQIGCRLTDCLPPEAYLARVGGDEFNVIIGGPQPQLAVEDFARGLREALKTPFWVEGRSFTISIAMGYAVGSRSEITPAELTRRADLAMYEAKNLRTDEAVRYHPGIESDSGRCKQIEDAMRGALVRCDEFEVHYQPVVVAETGRIRSAEALLRWTSPALGRISPDRFIPIAESSGLIAELGQWVIERVCRDLAATPWLTVSVNVSPAQLLDPAFAVNVAAILRRHDVASARMEFELTEGLIVEKPDLAAFKLDQLREAGHPIALDDFGKGFASIGYLRKMNFTKLKIDKSFIDDIGIKPYAEDLLRSLVFLARALGLVIVAEGVEQDAQADMLRGIGFDLLQGYLFAKPMPLDALLDLRETRGMGFAARPGIASERSVA